DVAVGDYNADGMLDVVAAADGESKFGVLLGNGDGTFRPVSVITDALMQRGWRLVPADFNRDGRLDVGIGFGHCCIDRGSGAFGLMLGNGDGTFQTILRFIRPQNGIISLAAIDPAVADFNGDGKLDVAAQFHNAVGGSTRGTIILTNTSGVSPRSLALGTFTADPPTLVGGTTGELDLSLAPGAVAPAGNLTFTLSNNNPSVASFPFPMSSPPFVMVQGMTNLRFKVSTNHVTTAQNVSVTIRHSSLGSRTLTLRVVPPSTPLALGSLEMRPSGVFGGNDASGVVTLETGHLAPEGGAVVTLTHDNPHLITSMPSSVTIPAGQTTAGFPVLTWTTATAVPVNFTASYGGVTKTGVMTVHPPSQLIPISSVTVSPQTVVGGSAPNARLTVALASNAPPEGATIMLVSSRPEIVPLPRSARIHISTQSSVSMDVFTNPVSTPTDVTITAYFGDSVQSTVLTVTPPAANTPVLSSLTLNPASVAGGSSSQGTVTISAPASSPTTVSLSSSGAPIVSVPAGVTIPAGATSASFTVSTSSVSSSFNSTITATLNGLSRTAVLTVNPAGDTVAIQRAEYETQKRTLRVEATSTRSNATLQVYVTSTSQLIGTLTNNGGGRYSATLNWSVNPQNITVRSSFGG
ncbi:MAG TPA: VCBS repeat-containing protein, partial [Pyrinomonadaceae bacterium]|nr:VCBS repeat-containing protein [Pyrinomonadaceae bacterium]